MLRRLKQYFPRKLTNIYHYAKALAAVCRWGYPARHLIVIGITGSDGKTSTSHIVYQVLKSAGLQASVITTTGAIIGIDDRFDDLVFEIDLFAGIRCQF